MGISVIICCYNSRTRLEPTLNHLALQKILNFGAELVLVDNHSTDDTQQFAQIQWRKLGNPFPAKFIFEETPGLSAARKKGAEVASHEYIIFCDDDNWLDANYLSLAYRFMKENKEVGAMGGFSTAVSEIEFPEWFEQYKGAYAVTDQLIETGELSDQFLLTGAGMVIRRNLFLKMFENVPSLLQDRKGKELSSGGDSEICLRLKLMGYKLYFNNNLKFKHFISKEKLMESYREKLFQGFKSGREIIDYYKLMLQIQKLSIGGKFRLLLLIFFKLPFTVNKLVDRWSLKRDLLTFYLIGGVDFLGLPPEWKQLRRNFLSKLQF